jgi:hypothetical protein
MRCKFPERDLSQRLDSTICRYKGVPYYVRYTDRNLLTLYTLSSNGKKNALQISPFDDDFDISTIPLGYCQASNDYVVYLSRRPNRLYKQGLSGDSLQFRWINGAGRFSFHWVSGAVEQMVLNNYPPLNAALDNLRRSTTEREIAISRDIAMKFNPNLKLIYVYFKGDEVGWIIPDTNIVIIPSSELAWIVSQHLRGFSWEVR